jgi:hypothetical protein
MIELKNDCLEFSFPEVHRLARIRIEFQRTLRIPDDGRDYPLPPGLGRFPVRHVDDFIDRIPPSWADHGGVMLPMYQAEAMWLCFRSDWPPQRSSAYPFAVRVATGKIDAVTGKQWATGLAREPQNYLVCPDQPWLDGYCIERGVIRQFVAMPLGEGYSAEEQLTGKAEHGGLQLQVFPMKREVYERRFPVRPAEAFGRVMFSKEDGYVTGASLTVLAPMGLAPGGRMRQEIYADEFDLSDWDTETTSRCFVHLANSQGWLAITGEAPPPTPATAAAYAQAGLPWFDYLDETLTPVTGSEILRRLKSVLATGKAKGTTPLPENDPALPGRVVALRRGLRQGQVREGSF